MLPSLFLPPLECCFGTIPSQAEKLRPDRKDFGSATAATKAVASTGPTPGVSSSLMLISLDRCQALISRSNELLTNRQSGRSTSASGWPERVAQVRTHRTAPPDQAAADPSSLPASRPPDRMNQRT